MKPGRLCLKKEKFQINTHKKAMQPLAIIMPIILFLGYLLALCICLGCLLINKDQVYQYVASALSQDANAKKKKKKINKDQLKTFLKRFKPNFCGF